MKLILDGMQGEVSSASGKPAIYLAECTPDRRRDRDLIGAELRRLGYPILPEGPLPWDEADYVAAVDEMLTGFENLLMIGRLLGLSRPDARKRAAELLERFALTEAGGRAAGTFSGGMRRRPQRRPAGPPWRRTSRAARAAGSTTRPRTSPSPR